MRIDNFKYRFIDQPNGWFGGTVKVDWPILVNLRLDPFERTGLNQSLFAKDWWVYEFWRFVFVQQEVANTPRRSSISRQRRRVRASTVGAQGRAREEDGADEEVKSQLGCELINA